MEIRPNCIFPQPLLRIAPYAPRSHPIRPRRDIPSSNSSLPPPMVPCAPPTAIPGYPSGLYPPFDYVPVTNTSDPFSGMLNDAISDSGLGRQVSITGRLDSPFYIGRTRERMHYT